MEMRLPADKLNQLIHTIPNKVKKGPLESLTDFLSHSCKVVRSGRIFLHRLISALAQVKNYHFVRLQSDLEWCYTFGTAWNDVSMLLTVDKALPAFSFTMEASGSWGYGAHSTVSGSQ